MPLLGSTTTDDGYVAQLNQLFTFKFVCDPLKWGRGWEKFYFFGPCEAVRIAGVKQPG
jgi:hypothetical protein